MAHIRTTKGEIEYPFNLSTLRSENPNTSFPREMSDELLAEFGVFKVEAVQRPAPTLTQDPVELPPQLIKDVWTQAWAMVDVAPEEAARRQKATAEEAHAEAIKADTFVQNFIAMTPAQVSAYVQANTANLAQVRALTEKMALMLLALARREFR